MSPQATLPFFAESRQSKKEGASGRVYDQNALILILLCIWALALLTVGLGLTCILPEDPGSLFPVELSRRASSGL
jgi:hypothetical protein